MKTAAKLPHYNSRNVQVEISSPHRLPNTAMPLPFYTYSQMLLIEFMELQYSTLQ